MFLQKVCQSVDDVTAKYIKGLLNHLRKRAVRGVHGTSQLVVSRVSSCLDGVDFFKNCIDRS